MTREISQNTLLELLEYNEETGLLKWRHRKQHHFSSYRGFRVWNARYAGTEAFSSLSVCGYKNGRVFNKTYKAHRLIWTMVYGEWLGGKIDIDHINGIRTDNRLINLRKVERIDNTRNAAIRKDNKSGCTGVRVSDNGKSWVAQIVVNGKSVHIGTFINKDDAIKARKEAERKYGFHPNHGREIAG